MWEYRVFGCVVFHLLCEGPTWKIFHFSFLLFSAESVKIGKNHDDKCGKENIKLSICVGILLAPFSIVYPNKYIEVPEINYSTKFKHFNKWLTIAAQTHQQQTRAHFCHQDRKTNKSSVTPNVFFGSNIRWRRTIGANYFLPLPYPKEEGKSIPYLVDIRFSPPRVLMCPRSGKNMWDR